MILQVRSAAQIMAVSIGLALAYSSGELNHTRHGHKQNSITQYL